MAGCIDIYIYIYIIDHHHYNLQELTNYKHMFYYMKWESLKANHYLPSRNDQQFLLFERATNATFLWFFGLWDVCCPHFTSTKVCPFLLHGFVQKISETLVLVKVRFWDFWQSLIWEWVVQLNRILISALLAGLVLMRTGIVRRGGSVSDQGSRVKMTLTRTQRHIKIEIGLKSYMATASG